MLKRGELERRDFLKFLGGATVAAAGAQALAASPRASNESFSQRGSKRVRTVPLNREDRITLASGFDYSILIRAGDPLTLEGESFGTGNDFIAFHTTQNPNEAYLWVNHELPDAIFLHGQTDPDKKTLAQVKSERRAVGGSYVHISKSKSGLWKYSPGHERNFRVTGETPIPFAGNKKILGKSFGLGTLHNCSGGMTPWNTFLTCEENFNEAYGDVSFLKDGTRQISGDTWGWKKYHPEPPEHYGWVVEVDPQTKKSKKLLSLGRFMHEGALVVQAEDGRCVVYMGDDASDRCLYKFISDKPGSLEAGKLYAADLEGGAWRSLAFSDNPIFKNAFGNELQTLIRTREAALIAGGTRLARPEGIARDPLSGNIFVSLTGDGKGAHPFGSILKIVEVDPLSLEFSHATFAAGGAESDFAHPDNVAFDAQGNLWMTTDISGKKQFEEIYQPFGNNALFLFPRGTGKALRIATAPWGAEFTGPAFSADGQTLFLCVQHPGEASKSREELKGSWPDDHLPRSAILTISLPESFWA